MKEGGGFVQCMTTPSSSPLLQGIVLGYVQSSQSNSPSRFRSLLCDGVYFYANFDSFVFPSYLHDQLG